MARATAALRKPITIAASARSPKQVPVQLEEARRGRRPVPQDETRNDRFHRLVSARMPNALHAIRLIGNLSAQGYAWDDEDIEVIRETLVQCIDVNLQRFSKVKVPHFEDTFSLRTPANSA